MTPPAVDRSELGRSVDAVRRSLVALDLAFSVVGVRDAEREKHLLRVPPSESYDPWELGDVVEGTVMNPLFEASGLRGTNPLYQKSNTAGENPMFDAGTVLTVVEEDISSLPFDATPETFAIVRDRANLWQVFFAAAGGIEQPDPAWASPTVRLAVKGVARAFTELRCVGGALAVEATTKEKSDPAALLATCRGYPALLAVGDAAAASGAALTAIEAEVRGLDTTLAETRAALVAFRDEVESAFGAGPALDGAAQAIVALDAYAASYRRVERTALLAALQAPLPDGRGLNARVRAVVLSKKPVTLDGDETAALQAAFADLLAKDGGVPGCQGGEGLECAISAFTSSPTFPAEAFIAYDDAFTLAMRAQDKGELTDVRAAAHAAQRKLVTQLLRAQTNATAAEHALFYAGAHLKTRHETAKNSVANVR